MRDGGEGADGARYTRGSGGCLTPTPIYGIARPDDAGPRVSAKRRAGIINIIAHSSFFLLE
jgi:hypothetical protein